jgi:2',3'-cyclic-nucleotide 2'-phosphodiesterase (5'-nucleotidase family)
MTENARHGGYEFMLFDSGDVIEGTGISDATPIHGQYIFPVVQKVKNYTALTIGNHGV